jgi:multiple sugar transport system permease protein
MSALSLPVHDAKIVAAENELIVPRYPRISIGRFSCSIVVFAIGIAFALPLLWMVLASFDKTASWDVKWPDWTLKNFSVVLAQGGLHPLLNSFYLASVATIASTIFAVLAAYPLARREVPFKQTYLLVTLFASGLPVTVMLVPLYQMYVELGLADSLFWTGMFLAASSIPFSMWLMKNFIESVPYELEEAAMMEGAGSLRVLCQVVLPLIVPGLAVTAIICFANAWGAFAVPLVLNFSSGSTPGAIAIYQFQSAFTIQIGPLAAYSLMFSIPVLVLYLLVSRHLRGAYSFGGGLKG